MLVFGWPTEQQKHRPKPVRFEQKHIVHENTYRSMDGEELRNMFEAAADRKALRTGLQLFAAVNIILISSKEMTRSVEEYLKTVS